MFHTGQRQDYNLSVSGKGETFTYYWSLGYKDSESVQAGDHYSNLNSRINLDAAVTNFLHIGINTQFVYRDESGVPVDNGKYHALSNFDTPYDENGDLELALAGSNVENPLIIPEYRDIKDDEYTFFPVTYVKLYLPFGIKFTSNITQRLAFSRYYQFDSPENPNWESQNGYAIRTNNQIYEWQIDNILNWDKSFNKHRFNVTFLQNAERYQSWYNIMTTENMLPVANLGYHEMSFGITPIINSDDNASTGNAIMGRINYSYGDRYNLSASYRRDGSSRFGSNYTYANFPSLSAAWTISEEAFMKDKISWLNYLKIRSSWGINGNSSGIGRYSARSALNSGKYLNATQAGIPYAVTYMTVGRMANASLAWEKNQSWNIGLDFGFLNNRLSGSIDVYRALTTDLLLNKQLPIITGFTSVLTNTGSVRNHGIEIALNSVNIDKENFHWRSQLNFAFNKNSIISLTGEKVIKTNALGEAIVDADGDPVYYEPDDITNGWFIGQDKNVVWDYKVLGTWKTEQEAEAATFNQKPGDFRLEDVNGDGILNNDDKQFLGSTNPKYNIAFTNNLKYKNFDLGIVVIGNLGYLGEFDKAKNSEKTYLNYNNWYDLPYWTVDNQLDDYARMQSVSPVTFSVWRSKSYLRLQSVSLGYNLPNKLLRTVLINDARVSFNIDNAACWSPDWVFGDPVSTKNMPRTFSFSLDFSF